MFEVWCAGVLVSPQSIFSAASANDWSRGPSWLSAWLTSCHAPKASGPLSLCVDALCSSLFLVSSWFFRFLFQGDDPQPGAVRGARPAPGHPEACKDGELG